MKIAIKCYKLYQLLVFIFLYKKAAQRYGRYVCWPRALAWRAIYTNRPLALDANNCRTKNETDEWIQKFPTYRPQPGPGPVDWELPFWEKSLLWVLVSEDAKSRRLFWIQAKRLSSKGHMVRFLSDCDAWNAPIFASRAVVYPVCLEVSVV